MSTTPEQARCELCGEPMPQGEEMFKFHGYSGPCPKPPLPRPKTLAPAAEQGASERDEVLELAVEFVRQQLGDRWRESTSQVPPYDAIGLIARRMCNVLLAAHPKVPSPTPGEAELRTAFDAILDERFGPAADAAREHTLAELMRAALAARGSGRWSTTLPESEAVWISEWSKIHKVWREPWCTNTNGVKQWHEDERRHCLFMAVVPKPVAPDAPPPAEPCSVPNQANDSLTPEPDR